MKRFFHEPYGLYLIILLLLTLFCNSCKKQPLDVDLDIPIYNIEELNKYLISDTVTSLCGSAANAVCDDQGNVYCVYLGSKTGYGEQSGDLRTSIFNLNDLSTIHHYRCVYNGERVNKTGLVQFCFEPTIILKSDKTGARIIFEGHIQGFETCNIFYRDIDINGNLSDIYPVYIQKKNSLLPISRTIINQYLTDHGFSPLNSIYSIHITSKITTAAEEQYGCITSTVMPPIVFKGTKDCSVLSLMSILASDCHNESSIELHNYQAYSVIRDGRGINIATLNAELKADNIWHIPLTATQRPQLFTLNGIMYLGCPYTLARLPNRFSPQISPSRCIISISQVKQDAITDKMLLYSKLGLVYPAFIIYKSRLYMIFSDGSRFPTKTTQGKDCLWLIQMPSITK